MNQLPFDAETLRHFFDQACNAAAGQTLPRFRADPAIENKDARDFDPVTAADRAAETEIRKLIAAQFPDHDIIGEEYGATKNNSPYQWIIDPIDGTRAFISGIPVWGTLIGLYHDGKPLAGVLDQPFTGERYMALPDGSEIASWLFHGEQPPKRIATKSTAELSDATMMTTSPHLLDNSDDRKYFEIEKSVKLFRYGCDCYAYAMLASGQIDLVMESGLNIYDIAALIPLIEGAGGVVTDWQGGSAAQGGQILAAANPPLHEAAIELLARQTI